MIKLRRWYMTNNIGQSGALLGLAEQDVCHCACEHQAIHTYYRTCVIQFKPNLIVTSSFFYRTFTRLLTSFRIRVSGSVCLSVCLSDRPWCCVITVFLSGKTFPFLGTRASENRAAKRAPVAHSFRHPGFCQMQFLLTFGDVRPIHHWARRILPA